MIHCFDSFLPHRELFWEALFADGGILPRSNLRLLIHLEQLYLLQLFHVLVITMRVPNHYLFFARSTAPPWFHLIYIISLISSKHDSGIIFLKSFIIIDIIIVILKSVEQAEIVALFGPVPLINYQRL